VKTRLLEAHTTSKSVRLLPLFLGMEVTCTHIHLCREVCNILYIGEEQPKARKTPDEIPAG